MDDSTFIRIVNDYVDSGASDLFLSFPSGRGSVTSAVIGSVGDRAIVMLKNHSGAWHSKPKVNTYIKRAAKEIARCNGARATTKGGWVVYDGLEYNIDPIY